MSRIIVKNLPKQVTANKLKELFSAKGFITDLQLKYSKSGHFRQFAFIGYKTDEEAKNAKDYFDNTCVYTSKIKVEICTDLSDPSRPKPRGKEAKLTKKKNDKLSKEKKEIEKAKKEEESGEKDVPSEVLNDSKFKEFLEVNKDRKSEPIWKDMEFDSSESEDEKTEVETETSKDNSKIKGRKNDNIQEEKPKKEKVIDDQFTVTLRNLPYKCKKKQIKEFFAPLKLQSLRMPPKCKGISYVKFKTEKEMNKALNKHRSFLGGHEISVIKYVKKQEVEIQENNKQVEDKEKDGELLAETGRIYVRNLCFSVIEKEIQDLFNKYGPLAEVYLPVDFLTKQSLGFAFVSYMFPEHAVKAFTELDGTVFQGRMLHLIPAKPKEQFPDRDDMSYKQKKESKLKALSGSSHNWNILFLGTNAVANVISEKYNIEKSKLLSGDDPKESVAVRMALAETQLVMETRKFLIDHGVELDAFSQAAAERSKTVVVVKNLPAKTTSTELYELFSKHGIVSQVILPPSGIAALIEFQEQGEAKSAFSRLAYSKFKSLPLYLEWAPMNIIKAVPENEVKTESKEAEEKPDTEETKDKSEGEEEEEPEEGTTLFVKNISFDTTDEDFKKHFKKCGSIHYAAISRKKDTKTGNLLSMGFGFVQFQKKKSAVKALTNLQQSKLDGHALELKYSTRATLPQSATHRKKSVATKQKTAKILVRNIPFQASEKEVKDLFTQFGTLKFVRLPKKFGGHEEHRGFGFVEFCTKSDAKRAFETLCHSTHLFGRRLVLEWANPESENVDELRRKTARDFVESSPRSKLKKKKLQDDVALAAARAEGQ